MNKLDIDLQVAQPYLFKKTGVLATSSGGMLRLTACKEGDWIAEASLEAVRCTGVSPTFLLKLRIGPIGASGTIDGQQFTNSSDAIIALKDWILAAPRKLLSERVAARGISFTYY